MKEYKAGFNNTAIINLKCIILFADLYYDLKLSTGITNSHAELMTPSLYKNEKPSY
jgi:hypothetical protein